VAHRDPDLGVVDGHLQQAFGRPDGPGRDQVPPLPDPLHGQFEALARLAEHGARGHPDVLEHQRGRAPLAHGRDRLGLPPHVAVDQEAGDPVVGHDREHHHEVGLVAVGDEGLLAVDDVVAAVRPGRGADVARVRAGPGLGDREAGAPLALDGRDQVALLLLVVGRVEDVVGVTAEPERHEGPAGLHHQDGRHDRAQVHAAVLLGRVHAPESAPAGLGLQVAQDGPVEAGLAGALVAQHLGLERHDFLLDEGPHGVPDLPFLVAEREVHHLR
jgi:hypothetical protein